MAGDGVARFDAGLRTLLPPTRCDWGATAAVLHEVPGLGRDAEVAVPSSGPNVALPRALEQRRRDSKLGRQITVDLQADANFDESGGGPGHDSFPYCAGYCRNDRL
jgi:hypothetical protein